MQQEITPFDLHRMFIGDYPLIFTLEIAVRTFIMYLFVLFMARIIGKRGMAELTPFEYIIVILIGSAAGDPMFYPQVPLFHGMVVISTVVIMEEIVARGTQYSNSFKDFVESKPSLVVSQGKLIKKNIQKEKMAQEDILMQLRLQGIDNLGRVEKAFLEPSGKLSVFQYKNPPKLTDSLIPRDN